MGGGGEVDGSSRPVAACWRVSFVSDAGEALGRRRGVGTCGWCGAKRGRAVFHAATGPYWSGLISVDQDISMSVNADSCSGGRICGGGHQVAGAVLRDLVELPGANELDEPAVAIHRTPAVNHPACATGLRVGPVRWGVRIRDGRQLLAARCRGHGEWGREGRRFVRWPRRLPWRPSDPNCRRQCQ